MKNLARLLLLASIFAVCAGCSMRNEAQPALEELAMIGTIAFDYVDDKVAKMTVIAPQPSPDAKEHTQAYTVEATLVREGLVQISSKSDRMVNLSQLRVVLFSEEFAKKGQVVDIVEFLYREADVRETVRIGIVAGNAGDVLTAEYPDKPNTNVYFNNLLEPKLFTTFSPFTDLHIFMADAKDPLVSPTLPYLEVKKELPEITHVALFDGANMIGKLTHEEGNVIQALSGVRKITPSVVNLNRDREVIIEFIDAKTKLTSNADFNSPKVKIKVDYEGALGEYRGHERLDKDDNLNKLEHDIEAEMEETIRRLIGDIKEYSADPIGLLEPLRMKYHGNWTDKLTDELLQKTEFDVQVDVSIVNIGALKK